MVREQELVSIPSYNPAHCLASSGALNIICTQCLFVGRTTEPSLISYYHWWKNRHTQKNKVKNDSSMTIIKKKKNPKAKQYWQNVKKKKKGISVYSVSENVNWCSH